MGTKEKDPFEKNNDRRYEVKHPGKPELDSAQLPPKKIPKPYLRYLKKIGFSIWLSVMIIGGILAFLTSLLLL